MRAECEEPEPRERKLDVVPPTLAEIDQRIAERIAAEREFMLDILAEVLARLQREWEKGATGPPGPSGPRGEQGPPGKLPLVKLWMAETVFYAGDVVAYDGGTYQAKRDTGQPPSHADWTCLAKAGRDGESFTVRGTYNPADTYAHLDVVAYNGASFVARKNAPGSCPGPDWQLLAKIGKRGERGLQGETGPRGTAAPTIRDWQIDRARYVATPIMSDGTQGPALELRALFEQFLLETER